MKGPKSQMKERLKWRRSKVQELAVKGYSQAEISRMLQISEATISRDADLLKEQAIEIIRNHIQQRLPYEYNKCLQGLEEIIKESWIIAAKAEKEGDTKEKLQSLSLIKDTYSTKMDLLTNASLLQDSIKFVEVHKNKLSNNNGNGKVNNNNGMERLTETNITESEPVF